MALKDILVHVDRSDAGTTRLRLSADLASRHGAHLTALHVRERSLNQDHRLKAAEMGLVPAAASEALDQAIEHELDQDVQLLGARIETLRSEMGAGIEFRSLAGRTGQVVAQQSRTADLTIVGHDVSDMTELPDGYSFAETMLFTSGRPLLMIPPSSSLVTLGRTVGVAWNGSRPAARALSDALALIEQAEQTFVLTVDPQGFAGHQRPSEDTILAHLGRHSGNVKAMTLHANGQRVADVLQAEALACGSDLLVAGAYGHPKLWEKILGGATRDLLAHMRMPILMSH